MVLQRQSGKTKKPLGIPGSVQAPADVVETGGAKDCAMKSASSDHGSCSRIEIHSSALHQVAQLDPKVSFTPDFSQVSLPHPEFSSGLQPAPDYRCAG
jgi:hypothetical protein